MQKWEYIEIDNIIEILSRCLGAESLKQVIKDGKSHLEDYIDNFYGIVVNNTIYFGLLLSQYCMH